MNRGERELRVIGGRLRGRKWRFPEGPGLRPTPDRVRETLFNWLQPRLPGARCLDLFAGSGALGIEALSRGAASVTFCETHAPAVATLRDTLALFGIEAQAVIIPGPAGRALALLEGAFDVVFLDPPFDAGLVGPTAALLDRPGLLSPGARIYVEAAAREALPALPPRWLTHREGKAGEVGYHLYRLQEDS